MSYLRSVLVAALALAFATVSADEASAKKQPPVKPSGKQQPAQTGHHPFHGKVVHVHHKKTDKHLGSISAKHHRHTADQVGDSTDTTVERKFHVSHSTTFERVDVYGKGAARVVSKAHFRDVHKGSHVTIHHKGHHATDVKIVHHHAAKVN